MLRKPNQDLLLSDGTCLPIPINSAADSSSAMRPIPTLDGQLRSQIKPGSCFACNKPGHWRAQCPLLTSKPRAGWTGGVVVSDVVANSVTTDFEYNVIDSDYSSSVATLKSLTHCEFVSGQTKVCSVRGNLANCYQEWVCHSRWVQNSIHCFSASQG